jgi:hypothetical protein
LLKKLLYGRGNVFFMFNDYFHNAKIPPFLFPPRGK